MGTEKLVRERTRLVTVEATAMGATVDPSPVFTRHCLKFTIRIGDHTAVVNTSRQSGDWRVDQNVRRDTRAAVNKIKRSFEAAGAK